MHQRRRVLFRAAELAETIASLNPRQARESAGRLCWLYSRAGNSKLTEKWAEKAYARDQNATSAFNLALQRQRAGEKMREYELLMEEALAFDASDDATLVAYGSYLMQKGDKERGREMVARAFESLHASYERGSTGRKRPLAAGHRGTCARQAETGRRGGAGTCTHARIHQPLDRANMLTRDDHSPIKRHAEP